MLLRSYREIMVDVELVAKIRIKVRYAQHVLPVKILATFSEYPFKEIYASQALQLFNYKIDKTS